MQPDSALEEGAELLLRTKVENLMRSSGYLNAGVKLSNQSSFPSIDITTGPRFYLGSLSFNEGGQALPQLERTEGSYILNEENFKADIDHWLTDLGNKGYPFASFRLSKYRLTGDTLSGELALDRGPYISFDSVTVKGFNSFSKHVLVYDLKYRSGMPYSEEYLQKLPEHINRVEYLRFSQNPGVAFIRDKTTLFLYMEKVRSNEIDGVVGINTDADGNVSFTGDFKLRLLNTFNRGEEFDLQWQRPDDNIQRLKLGLKLPYLFKTPFWLDGSLEIFRQDSSFVNTNMRGLVKYALESGSFITGGIDYVSSNSLGETAEATASDINSFNTVSYRLGVEINKLDRVIIPTSGYNLALFAISGQRNTTDNSNQQFGWDLLAENYWRFGKRHVLWTSGSSKALIGENLFLNELFRLGGLKTLRGFNEQSIFSSSYVKSTVEYRLMLGEFDYLSLFSDAAYLETKTGDTFDSNVVLGLGTGLNFRTRQGIFSLSLAVGRDTDNPFDFRAGKVHFGYVNRF